MKEYLVSSSVLAFAAPVMAVAAFLFAINPFINLMMGDDALAQVAVYPNSYVSDGEKTRIVEGQPALLDGQNYSYENVRAIPITQPQSEGTKAPILSAAPQIISNIRPCKKVGSRKVC